MTELRAIRDALLLLREASKGWPDGNSYALAVDPALAEVPECGGTGKAAT